MLDSTMLKVALPSIVNDNWASLMSLLRALEQDGSTFGNIGDALEQFFQPRGIYERLENTWNQNETTKHQLEASFRQLRENCANLARLGLTECMRGLCRDIRVELTYIRHYPLLRLNDENGAQAHDSGALLSHYQRIQALLQGLLLNAEPSLWNVLNRNLGYSCTCGSYNPTRATEQGSCTHPVEVRQLHNWVQNSLPGAVCWIPDARKMDISRALCAKLNNTHKLGASIFISRDNCDFNSIIPSIAFQLANYSTPFRFALLNLHPHACFGPLEIQFEELIANPLARVRAALPVDLTVVIDVMNGCKSVRPLIDAILAKSKDLPIKFFVFSPPEPCYDVLERLLVHQMGGLVVEEVKGKLRAALQPFGLSELQLAGFVQRAGALFACAAVAAHQMSDDGAWFNHSSALVDG
ncbi:vegetative incompatibility protein HET-E-1, putative [Rhizoctonia solani AG-3 Rhs1AP]|uniref:Vegetative incompatibility protein HET-E-1, putative n=1 Tax=Rhizoctonia solani AG-3 Rhs1AP TaxID=1086054 RepID=X8J6Q3_9AGAM|nr:vegetative incompatibility protein HET-E-1, putative [Rhizoctonia solani AG-3 Rhs1AP]